MNRNAFDRYCSSLTGTSMVVQWGGAHVWKVGSKVFALCSNWGNGTNASAEKPAFKCSDLAFQILTEQPGIRPAPYLGRYKWVQVEEPDALSQEDLKAYIKASYDIIAAKLTKAERKKIGL